MSDALIERVSMVQHSVPLAHYGRSGVYLLHHENAVVYVGQAVNMRKRIGQHMAEGTKVFDGLSCIPCSAEAMLRWERFLIGVLLPKYNRCSLSEELRRMQANGADRGALLKVIGRPPRAERDVFLHTLGLVARDLEWRDQLPVGKGSPYHGAKDRPNQPSNYRHTSAQASPEAGR